MNTLIEQEINTEIDPFEDYAAFGQIVGQVATKRKYKFYIDGYRKSNIMPNLLVVAPRGSGKNLFTDALAENLVPKGHTERKVKILINSSTIKSVKDFWDNVVLKYLYDTDKHYTIIFDECHTLTDDMTSMLLTILNPNKTNENVYTYNKSVVYFNFFRHTFVFLTTEGHRVFHALADRLERVEIGEYTNADLAKIITRYLDIGFDQPETLHQVSQTVRTNPRNAVKMAEKIKAYCNIHGKEEFTASDWEALKEALDIKPYGLSEMEMQYLHLLKDNRPVRLGILASRLSMTPKSLQGDLEVYLNKLGLIENTPEGRQITVKGYKVINPSIKVAEQSEITF